MSAGGGRSILRIFGLPEINKLLPLFISTERVVLTTALATKERFSVVDCDIEQMMLFMKGHMRYCAVITFTRSRLRDYRHVPLI
jgi:hypothetical protein